MGGQGPEAVRRISANDSPALAQDLTPERWQQVKDLFAAAQEREPTQRTAFLVEACGSDELLRAEVESLLLVADNEPPAPNSTEASRDGSGPVHRWTDSLIGQRIGPYKIEKQIGRGGMATVYLASRADEEYHKQVAAKVLLPELDSEDLLRRFRSERQTLAVLDHANIVKLLDGGSTKEGLPYLVMDYVKGEPVDTYCDSRKLSTESRLRLFQQVCMALQYAHDHHVVHRDLKPSNILVTPQGIPKLLDFGIAKVLEPVDESQAVITQTRTRRMTPAYASPEQVKAEPVTAATDVYSLGVVLYELLTGHRPYKLKQNTPAEIERAICDEDPEKPSTAVDRVETTSSEDGAPVTKTPETVSQTREGNPEKLRRCLRGDLDTILLMALQKEPQRRYASARALAEDIQRHLDHLPVKARRSTVAYRSSKFFKRHRAEALTVAMATFLLVIAALFWWEDKRAAERAQTEVTVQHMPGRPSVAVLGFKNLSGRPEAQWLSTAFSEMLTTELAAGGQLRTIPGENIGQMRVSLKLADEDALSRETLRRVRNNVNSDFVVLGSYLDQGGSTDGRVRLDVRLQDAVTGETAAAITENGTETGLSDLISQAGSVLRSKLGAKEISPSEAASVKASFPPKPEAARLYSEGLAKLRSLDAVGARDLLKKAIAAAPDFAMAHSALADAWRTLGHDKEEREDAKVAFDLAGSLPREQSLLIEANYRRASREWDRAIEIDRTLSNFFPDNLDYGLRLASVLTAAGRGNDALATVESLRKLPAPEGTDPRLDLAESSAANSISDYKRQIAAAAKAAQKAEGIGARLLLAQARFFEGRGMVEMGKADKALPLLQEGENIYAAAGDRFGQARILQVIGLTSYYKGDLSNAKAAYQQALSIQRELGNRPNEARLWNGIGMVLDRQNDAPGAKQAYLQALAICREIDDRPMTGTALGNLGGVEAELGDYRAAQEYFQKALAIARQVGEQSAVALQLNNLAFVHMSEGNVRAAVPFFQESIQISRKTGKKRDLGIALINLSELQYGLGELEASRITATEARQVFTEAGNQANASIAVSRLGTILLQQGDLAAARKQQEEALAVREELGDKLYIQDSRLNLASVALEEGNPEAADISARSALTEFAESKQIVYEAQAGVLLSRALLAQGKLEEAQRAIAEARKLAAKAGERDTQISSAIVDAQVEAALRNYSQATSTLEQAIADAHNAGLAIRQFEGRFALGKTEIMAGRFATGRAELRMLEREATAKGLLLIAHKAAEAEKPKTRRSIAESR